MPEIAREKGAAGLSARNLRAHSDGMWNGAVNDWVGRHLAWTDIEVEAKHKNIVSRQLEQFAPGSKRRWRLDPDKRDKLLV